MPATEAQPDKVLAEALIGDKDFARWLLDKTRFQGAPVTCVMARCDNPWSSVKLEGPNPASGEIEILSRECETDVLAVFETTDQRRFALHIENKLAGGGFTPDQPELYQARLTQWRNREKLGKYSDAASVLVAPRLFFERNEAQCRVFDFFVLHEEIATRLPAFAGVEASR